MLKIDTKIRKAESIAKIFLKSLKSLKSLRTLKSLVLFGKNRLKCKIIG